MKFESDIIYPLSPTFILSLLKVSTNWIEVDYVEISPICIIFTVNYNRFGNRKNHTYTYNVNICIQKYFCQGNE